MDHITCVNQGTVGGGCGEDGRGGGGGDGKLCLDALTGDGLGVISACWTFSGITGTGSGFRKAGVAVISLSNSS